MYILYIMAIKTRKGGKAMSKAEKKCNKKQCGQHKKSRKGKSVKGKSKKKIPSKSLTRKSLLTRKAVGGDRGAAVHRTRRVTQQISSQKNCVHGLFVALEKLAGAKTKVDYLLDSIGRGRGLPMRISQWKALFNANKFRKSNTSALKKNLMDINEYGSIAQLSAEAMDAVRQTGKALENNIGTRNSGRNILRELDLVFRNNVGHDFINIQDDGGAGGEGHLDKNIWQPEADLLFAAESADMYNFDNIEESKILNQPPIKVKLDFSDQSITRMDLGFLWNFLFDAAANSNDVEVEGALARNDGEASLVELCQGWRGLHPRKILRTINTLTGVYEKRFTVLIPYLPADMFKDTPEGDPDYDDVARSGSARSSSARSASSASSASSSDSDDGSASDDDSPPSTMCTYEDGVNKWCLDSWLNYDIDHLYNEVDEDGDRLPLPDSAYEAGMSEEDWHWSIRRRSWAEALKHAIWRLDDDWLDGEWLNDVDIIQERMDVLVAFLDNNGETLRMAMSNACWVDEDTPDPAVIECQVFRFLLEARRDALAQ